MHLNITIPLDTFQMSQTILDINSCEIQAIILFSMCCGILLFGSLLIGVITIGQRKRRRKDIDEENLQKLLRLKRTTWIPKYAETILTGKNYFGRILLLLRSLSCLVCMTIYLWNTYESDRDFCIPFNGQSRFYIEMSCNSIFLLMFILRAIASNDLFATWMSIYSLIDHCTIFIIFSTFITKSYQFTFGFLYFARLTKIPESLVLLRIINQERSIRSVNLIFKLLAAWTIIAGIVLVLERTGNFWTGDNVRRNIEYLDCLYMILVTLATVGYGDIVCTSYLGRIFIIFVIIGALITVTTHMSELSELFQQNNQYHRSIYIEHNPRHIVVCGCINYKTVSIFFNEYVNADKGHYDENMTIVILSENDPGIRLKALLQRESTTITFLKGSVTIPEDLDRAKVRTAEAVIILSNKRSQTPDEDDWKNLMCVVSIKNLNPKIRIICELMLFESKGWMSNIPGWNEYQTDQFDRAICMPQMKFGLLALNCISNGASTLLCNFIMRDSVPTSSVTKTLPRWINEYLQGTRYKLYTVRFSRAFDGMMFQQLVGLAMELWGILLLAVHIFLDNEKTEMIINPGCRMRINTHRMQAVVLAKNLIEAQRLRTFTMDDQLMFDNLGQIILTPAAQDPDNNREQSKTLLTRRTQYTKQIKTCMNFLREPLATYKKIKGNKLFPKISKCASNFSIASHYRLPQMDSVIPDLTRVQRLNSIDLQCDSTGLFYWVAERKFSDVCLTMKAMIQCQFKNHIIVCITKQPKGIKLGLASFVLPLRSTSIPIKEVKPIIIVCESKVIEKEWRSLKNFPGIYVLSGSPLYRANLRAAGVETCSTCVVLSCLHDTSGRPSLMIDKESILCTLNIRQLLAEANKTNNTERNQPMLVSELYDLHNASLLSTASKNGSTYFSPLIASGNIVESDVLHSLSSNVLFDPTVITFIETILGGGPGHEVEKVFAIDSGFFPGLRGQPISTLMFPDYLTGNIPYEVNNARHTNNQVYSKDTQNTVTTTIGSDFDSVTTEQFKIFFKDNNLLKKLFQFDPELKSHELNDNCMESSRSTTGEIFSDTDNTKEKISTDNEQINFKSFLSYKTETGDEVTVRLSQLLLVPLEELNSDLYQLASQRVLTFNELFHTVLVNTGTITVGLYRRVEDSKNTREDISYENAHEVSASIERFVYTLPEPKTIIYPNDMVYCLTAMTENPMTEQQIL